MTKGQNYREVKSLQGDTAGETVVGQQQNPDFPNTILVPQPLYHVLGFCY